MDTFTSIFRFAYADAAKEDGVRTEDLDPVNRGGIGLSGFSGCVIA